MHYRLMAADAEFCARSAYNGYARDAYRMIAERWRTLADQLAAEREGGAKNTEPVDTTPRGSP
jgi:hypothetical protein